MRDGWSPTVRPPKLGGNKRIGVFATRSPFRPNEIGLSSVRLDRVEPNTPDGPVLHISGADLMDGTPIFDIKPYLAYTDSHPEALGGFALTTDAVRVECPQACSKAAEGAPSDAAERTRTGPPTGLSARGRPRVRVPVCGI